MAVRDDSFGIFWNDIPSEKAGPRETGPRPMPPIPNTGWTQKPFVDLSGARIIAIDTETKDVDLLEKGPGVRRGAYIVGISVGTDDGFRGYYPIRHEFNGVESPYNLPPKFVFNWLRKELGRENQEKIGANILYDLDFLAEEQVIVRGKIHDVQIAEPLLDENQFTYNLDRISKKWLGEGKVDNELYTWCARAFGGEANRRQAANIWRAPVELVGPYAEGDVDLPLRIFEKQQKQLHAENLTGVYDLETRLIPMLMAMRRRGVAVDIPRAKTMRDDWDAKRIILNNELRSAAGLKEQFNVDLDDHLKALFVRLGIEPGKTEKGNVSFAKGVLENRAIQHPACKAVMEVRKINKGIGTYIDGYILGHAINGRIHCQFNQLRSDDGGTVSGRFSSSNPNLQNIPSRDDELSILRELFVPEPGQLWVKDDYSSIEPRVMTHYGTGPSADKLRATYAQDPYFDFYELAKKEANVTRNEAKKVQLADMYGRGVPSLAAELGVDLNTAKLIKGKVNEAVPFVAEIAQQATQVALSRGYIFTMSGRRRRFDLWEPASWDLKQKLEKAGKRAFSANKEEALAEWGRVKRAFGHKALNSLIQGGAADYMKKGMVDIWESGICDVLGAPLITVHDELDDSADMSSKAHLDALKEKKHLMENAYKLTVPIVVEREIGPNWKQVKKVARG
jgi:DNA polymerase I-like protein with 3'-5' exonuclease and polymerase domains